MANYVVNFAKAELFPPDIRQTKIVPSLAAANALVQSLAVEHNLSARTGFVIVGPVTDEWVAASYEERKECDLSEAALLAERKS